MDSSLLLLCVDTLPTGRWLVLGGLSQERPWKDACHVKEYTLVVVDMQPDFPASNNPATLRAVEREVRKAIKHRLPVVVLEIPYFSPLDEDGLKPTHRSIMRLLTGYDHYRVVQKRWSDGSSHVILTCEDSKYMKHRFRICGVNTDACVLETVLGLAKRLPKCKIRVIKNACNTVFSSDCWDKFLVAPNVKLKRGKNL